MSLIDKIFGDGNQKYLKSLQPLIDQINNLEKKFEGLSIEKLREKTFELKKQLEEGKVLDDILPEAFAIVREAAKQTLGQRHFDVQLLGGIVLHKGQIAEMRTGEGKTLTSTLPVFLNALEGNGVHVVTVNDYLAKRDAVWMGQIFNLLGLSVGCIQHDGAFLYDKDYEAPKEVDQERDLGVVINQNFLRPVSRKDAYLADITYGTNNEFGFDYLRDNMVQNLDQMVQRDLHYAIIDEVDSILIDEARTPLIISGPAEESAEMYQQFARIVKTLKENEDYNIDEKLKAATLTEEGLEKVEKTLGVKNIYESHGIKTVHHLESALRAETLFKLDKDYVVKDGEVIIVDEFTGRLMQGRRYSEGLHQAIEAKEGVKVQRESVTMATITFQNYFRMYNKLSGMTGTAATESEEFSKIYSLDVTVIPTNKPLARDDKNDLIYKTEHGKYQALVKEVKERQLKGQPVLIGSISIEKNELISQYLERAGIKHEILNAKNHEREAQIIAQAGSKGSVTLATNMAGRGVDIILGGNPSTKEQAEEIKSLGGLCVIGTERHESRRIDNQLRGRSGRQGDPGISQFFVSLDDDLMRIFGSERIKSLMTTLKVPEDMPIQNSMISRSLESAQKKVEGNNFDIRKHLVEYDDVINKQREIIYKKRKEILRLSKGEELEEFKSTKDLILNYLKKDLDNLVNLHFNVSNEPDSKEIIETISTMFSLTEEERLKITKADSAEILQEYLFELCQEKYTELEENVSKLPELKDTKEPLRQIEKNLLLQTIDTLWIDHLSAIDHLRTGIGLRGYGQRDPLLEYKKDSFELFKGLLNEIQGRVISAIFKVGQVAQLAASPMTKATSFQAPAKVAMDNQSQIARMAGQTQKNRQAQETSSRPKNEMGEKVGRNDPCPCGSGLKYKKCHGK